MRIARSVADWREVLSADEIDAIVIGTRTEAHYEMIPPVLEAGRHGLFTANASNFPSLIIGSTTIRFNTA